MCKCFKSVLFFIDNYYIYHNVKHINEHKYVIGLVCHVLNGLKAPEGLNSFGFCDKKQHVV